MLLNNLHGDLALFGALFVVCFCSLKDAFNLYMVHVVILLKLNVWLFITPVQDF